MHLHISNLNDFQLLKYDAFVVNEKIFRATESIKDAIMTFNVDAKLRDIQIVQKFSSKQVAQLLSEVITDAERVIQVL